MTATSAPLAVVCDDRPDMRRVLPVVLERCGLTVAGVVERLPALLEVVEEAVPAVAVLELPAFGAHGLEAIRAVRRAAPHCQIVVLSPFDALEASVLAAGARVLLADEDMRGLSTALRAIVAEAAAGRSASPPAQRGSLLLELPVSSTVGRDSTNAPS